MSETLKLVVPVDERDHTLGPADASDTVVNYGDYQCPDCHRRHKEIQKMIDELTGSEIRLSTFSARQDSSACAKSG